MDRQYLVWGFYPAKDSQLPDINFSPLPIDISASDILNKNAEEITNLIKEEIHKKVSFTAFEYMNYERKEVVLTNVNRL